MLLRSGTIDLPRMTKILSSERVFLLVNEATIKRYRSTLAEEVEPTISELIECAEEGLATLERKEQHLQTKVENAKAKTRPGGGTSAAQKNEARKLQTLKSQRERLEKELQALEWQVAQLERKSRQ